jgi:hypothetical protein
MSSSVDPLVGTSLMPMSVSYTALIATLVLLLAVSSAIVIRSLILRRRHHRLVEEAIRTGTWLPHHFESGRRRRDIGLKPRLWEAWLNPDEDEDEDESEENKKGKWGDLMVGDSMLYGAYSLTIRFVLPFLACVCRICQSSRAITSGAHSRFHGEFRRPFIAPSTVHTTFYEKTLSAIATTYHCVADGWPSIIFTLFISDNNAHPRSTYCSSHCNAQSIAETAR